MTLPLEEKERYDPSNAVWWLKKREKKNRDKKEGLKMNLDLNANIFNRNEERNEASKIFWRTKDKRNITIPWLINWI